MAMTFSLNDTPADVTTVSLTMQSFLYYIKTKLVAAGWTVKASSNGTSYSASADLWTSYTAFGGTTVHWWTLLESPAGIITGGTGKIWLVLDAETATPSFMATAIHNVLPTGGSTTTTPTSTNQTGQSKIAFFNATAIPLRFNFVAWSNGTFWFGSSAYGTAVLTSFLAVYPISNIVSSYPYAVCAKQVFYASRWVEAVFDLAYGWNVDGTACTGKIRTRFLSGGAGAVGAGVNASGDLQGKHPYSDIYLHNDSAGSYQQIGMLGAEGYNFGITGATTLANGTVDANTVTKCLYGSLWLPANDVILS